VWVCVSVCVGTCSGGDGGGASTLYTPDSTICSIYCFWTHWGWVIEPGWAVLCTYHVAIRRSTYVWHCQN
jgi:hypothetical protein